MRKKSGWAIITLILALVVMVMLLIACGGSSETNKNDIIGVYASNTEFEYDGQAHSIKIENTFDGDIINYSLNGESDWSEINPAFITPGEYIIYYKVSRSGYNDFVSFATLIINKQILTGISANNVTIIYDGNEHGITVEGVIDGDVTVYSLDGENFGDDYKQTDVGEYTVFYRVEREYGEYRDSARLTILPNIQGVYLNRESGAITLSVNTAIIGNQNLLFTYDVDGNGTIGEESVSVADGILKYNGKEYKQINDGENIYRISSGETEVYVVGGDSISVDVIFDQDEASVSVNEEIIMRVENVNYCENATTNDYSTTNATITFPKSGVVTDCEIILSERLMRTAVNIDELVIYDGSEHSYSVESDIDVIYLVDGEYTSVAPKYIEIGTYTAQIIYMEDGYLPTVISAKLTIAPSIEGTYFTSDTLIIIDGNCISVNGEVDTCEFVDGAWRIGNIEIEITDKGIILGEDEIEYVKQTENMIVVFVINGSYYVMAEEFDNIMIVYYDDGTLVVNNSNGDEFICIEVGTGGITVSVNGDDLDGFRFDADAYTFIIGIDELKLLLSVINITSSAVA